MSRVLFLPPYFLLSLIIHASVNLVSVFFCNCITRSTITMLCVSVFDFVVHFVAVIVVSMLLQILADDYDDAPSCTARPKRSKPCSSTKTCSTRTLKSTGLSQCTSVKTIIKVSQPVLSDTVATVTEKADHFS
jgi:hypothetical protein